MNGDIEIPKIPRLPSGRINLEAYRIEIHQETYLQKYRLNSIEKNIIGIKETDSAQNEAIKKSKRYDFAQLLGLIIVAAVVVWQVWGITATGLVTSGVVLLTIAAKLKSLFG